MYGVCELVDVFARPAATRKSALLLPCTINTPAKKQELRWRSNTAFRIKVKRILPVIVGHAACISESRLFLQSLFYSPLLSRDFAGLFRIESADNITAAVD